VRGEEKASGGEKAWLGGSHLKVGSEEMPISQPPEQLEKNCWQI